MLSARAIRWLKAANWSDDYRWLAGPVLEEELLKKGHRPNAAALRFLSRYGGLVWHRFNPYQPNAGTVMCHTDALSVAERMSPAWCEAGAAVAGSSLCPIGEDGYGHFLMTMDEQGRVLCMDDHTLAWKEFDESGEAFLDNLCSDWAIEEVEKGGVWPQRPSRK